MADTFLYQDKFSSVLNTLVHCLCGSTVNWVKMRKLRNKRKATGQLRVIRRKVNTEHVSRLKLQSKLHPTPFTGLPTALPWPHYSFPSSLLHPSYSIPLYPLYPASSYSTPPCLTPTLSCSIPHCLTPFCCPGSLEGGTILHGTLDAFETHSRHRWCLPNSHSCLSF